MLLGANVQEVHVVGTSIIDRTVHVRVRLSQGVQVVVVSTNAEGAVSVALARTRSRSGAITARQALAGSRSLGESVGRANGTFSDRAFRGVGVTTRAAFKAARFSGRSVSTARAVSATFSTTLTFNDVAHTDRVDSDLVVTSLQIVVVLLEVERNLMLTSSQSQSALSNFITVEHAVERAAELASRGH